MVTASAHTPCTAERGAVLEVVSRRFPLLELYTVAFIINNYYHIVLFVGRDIYPYIQ